MNRLQIELEIAAKNHQTEVVEKILKEQLKIKPDNIEKLIELSLAELATPLCDYFSSLKYIHCVLKLDPNNIFAILIECCVNDFYLGGIDDQLYKKLESIKTEDTKWKSIIKYMMSQYYRFDKRKIDKQKVLLEESVELCDEFVHNLRNLSYIYISEGRKKEGIELLQKAINNVKCIYDSNSSSSIISIDDFLNEYVKGTHKTYILVEALNEELEKLKN